MQVTLEATVLKVVRIFLRQPVDNETLIHCHYLQINSFGLILMNRNSVIPKTQEKLTDKHSHLPYFAYHVQSSPLCRTAQAQTYFFRYYR